MPCNLPKNTAKSARPGWNKGKAGHEGVDGGVAEYLKEHAAEL